MRHGRAKAARKTLQFFRRTHGYAPPYHVLLDGTFVVSILRFKIPLLDRLRSVLQGETFHLYVTRSTLSELSKLQQAHQMANNREDKAALFEEAHRWAVANTTVLEEEGDGESSDNLDENDGKDHGDKSATHSRAKRGSDHPTGVAAPGDSNSTRRVDDAPRERVDRVGMSPAGREMLRIVTAASTASSSGAAVGPSDAGKSKGGSSTTTPDPHCRVYFFASQDEALLEAVRSAGCAPIVRLAHNSVLLLEQPSRASHSLAARAERHKWSASSAVSGPERELVRLVQAESRHAAKADEGRKSTHASDPTGGRPPNQQYQQRNVKKAKGPNPLSCRKKDPPPRHEASASRRSNESIPQDELERPSKRRRRRK